MSLTIGSEMVGAFLLRWLRIPSMFPKALVWGVGLVVLTFLLTGCGIVGLYVPTVMWLLVMGYFTAALVRIIPFLKRWIQSKREKKEESDLFQGAYQVCVIVLLAVCLLTVLTPETRHDPYDYHLTIPTLYLVHGGIVEIPWHVFSYMPKNGEMLFGLGLGIGNDSITKLIHYIFGIYILILIGWMLKRCFSREAGWMGAVMVITLPLYGFLATSSYIDLIRSFWELAALFTLSMIWVSEEEKEKVVYLYLSALFAGMAMGTKYVAWLVFGLPYLVLFIITFSRFKPVLLMKHVFWVLIAGVLPVLSWLSYNAIWTGNPIYPLLPSIFGMHIPSAEEAYTFFRNHAPQTGSILWPNVISFVLSRFGNLLLEGNALVLLGTVAVILYPWWSRKEIGNHCPRAIMIGLILYVILSSLLFFVGTANDDGRFFFSTMVLLAIPTTYLLYAVRDELQDLSTIQRYILPAVMLILFTNALTYRFVQLQDQGEAIIPMITESQRDDFLARRFYDYNAIHWGNEHLPEDAFVLGIGYPLRRNHISGIKKGYIPFLQELPARADSKTLAKHLQEAGVTHIIKPYPFDKNVLDFSILEPDYLKPVYRHRRTSIYKLIEPQKPENQ